MGKVSKFIKTIEGDIYKVTSNKDIFLIQLMKIEEYLLKHY